VEMNENLLNMIISKLFYFKFFEYSIYLRYVILCLSPYSYEDQDYGGSSGGGGGSYAMKNKALLVNKMHYFFF
jgi:hypothetical protein